MTFKIKEEAELLDKATLVRLAEHIQSEANVNRKLESLKRYECYKDRTKDYVVKKLLAQFKPDTVNKMAYAVSNISIVKKIITKLARAYQNGATRKSTGNKSNTTKVNELAGILDANTKLKETDRYLRLQHNDLILAKMFPIDGNEKDVGIKFEVYNPHLYDVVVWEYNQTQMAALVFSDLALERKFYTTADPGYRNIPTKEFLTAQKDVVYTLWSNGYYFKFDSHGEITLIGDDNQNPVSIIPAVDFAWEQGNEYWAQGGFDLVDGAVYTNAIITQTTHISVYQGYGQFWMKGQNLPENIAWGPSDAILMKYKLGEAEPDLGFASANPDIDKYIRLVETYVALLLSTNNLKTTGVQTSLQGPSSVPSGIALMLENAESSEDVKDQQEIFRRKEKVLWRMIAQIQDKLGSNLNKELRANKLPIDVVVDVIFPEPNSILSEKEKLEIIKMRQDLGINLEVELIMADTGMDKKEAEKKLLEIKKEQIERMSNAIFGSNEDNNDEPGNKLDPKDSGQGSKGKE